MKQKQKQLWNGIKILKAGENNKKIPVEDVAGIFFMKDKCCTVV